jgi:ABC-type multidrug transport system, ATPase and permease components
MNNNKETIKRLLHYIAPYRISLVCAMLFAVTGISLSLSAPVLIGHAIDRILGERNVDFHGILKTALLLLFITLVSAFFNWLMSVFANKITYGTVKGMRTDAFSKLSRVPLSYIDSHSHGDMMGRIVTDTDLVSDGLYQGMTQLFGGVVTILATLFFMLGMNPAIALVVVVLTPLSLFVASFIAKRTHSMFSRQAKLQGELSGFVREAVENLKLIKAFGYEESANNRFAQTNDKLKTVGIKAQFYSSLSNPATRFVNNVVFCAVGVFGALNAIGAVHVFGAVLTVGEISAFLAYSNQYTKPFNEVTGVIPQLQTAIASAARIFALIDEPHETVEAKAELSKTDGSVTMENVSFSYSPDSKLIEQLNLTVQKGNKIAIVGPTGCGKTTLINLLMRFYDVTSGNIRMNGTDIRAVTRKSVRDKYGMVLQETWLFSGTVRENIAYGKPEASLEEIKSASIAAYAHSFIERLPDGYDTVITEQGDNLSEGQKQLLCIARIMLLSPPMLILDEATSSIDTMTEQRIQKAFADLMKDKTSFVVAHRLSTVRDADMILVMKDGTIQQKGTHDELLKAGGLYSDLYYSNVHH